MAGMAMDEAGEAIDDRLEELEAQFKEWREGRRRGERIPPSLWDAAAELARDHGVPRVANRLRLNAAFLTRRLASPVAGQAQPEAAEPEFVELLTAPAAPAIAPAAGGHEAAADCVVELHNARGATMRVELNAGALAGLAHLCRAFWSAA
jgi:hypothetical protein